MLEHNESPCHRPVVRGVPRKMLTLRRIDESRKQLPVPVERRQGIEGEIVQSAMPHEPHAEWKSEAVLLLGRDRVGQQTSYHFLEETPQLESQ